MKLRYEQITQLGNIEEQYITNLKSTSKFVDNMEIMDITAEFCYENVAKAPVF